MNIRDIAQYNVEGAEGSARYLLYTANREQISYYIREGLCNRKLPAIIIPSPRSPHGMRYEVKLSDALEFRKFIEEYSQSGKCPA